MNAHSQSLNREYVALGLSITNFAMKESALHIVYITTFDYPAFMKGNKLFLVAGVPIAIGLVLFAFSNQSIVSYFNSNPQKDDGNNVATSQQVANSKPFTSKLFLDATITNDTIIPPVDYGAKGHDVGDSGKHYPPANVANKCMYYFSALRNSTATEYGVYVATWLSLHGDEHQTYIAYPYDFNWPTYNLTSGWHSALAQSTISDCYIKAYQATSDPLFLDLAKKSLMFIGLPVEQGGVMIDEGNSKWWYEEYAGQNLNDTRSYVLNGHQFVLLSMNNYLKIDNDPAIRQMFNNGLKAFEEDAHLYDRGTSSWYDRVGNVAGKYHNTHIVNTQKLYDITKDEKLLEIKKMFET